jgi:hypothetical protein
MLRRHGPRLLAAAALTMVATGVAWSVMIGPSRPPRSVAALFERIRVGMSYEEVSKILDRNPEVQIMGMYVHGGVMLDLTYSFGFLGPWTICVEYGREGTLVDKSLVHTESSPWHKRAWERVRRAIPSLPDLPF